MKSQFDIAKSESQFDIAFDWDGTLTSADGPIGRDNGAAINLEPLTRVLDAGYTAAIMTCNDPLYVAHILEQYGVPTHPDTVFQYKIPDPLFTGKVLVTGRKVLARVYADDRNILYQYGMNPRIPLIAAQVRMQGFNFTT